MKKTLLAVLLAISICVSVPFSASASTDSALPWYCCRLPSQYVMLSNLNTMTCTILDNDVIYNNCQVNIGDTVIDGAQQWEYNGTEYPDVSLTQLNYSNTRTYTIYFSLGYYNNNADGGCIFLDTDFQMIPAPSAEAIYPEPTGNWAYCVIRINLGSQDVMDGTVGALKALGAHEMGHAFGLNHCLDITHGSIMFKWPIDIYHEYLIGGPTNNDRATLLFYYS